MFDAFKPNMAAIAVVDAQETSRDNVDGPVTVEAREALMEEAWPV